LATRRIRKRGMRKLARFPPEKPEMVYGTSGGGGGMVNRAREEVRSNFTMFKLRKKFKQYPGTIELKEKEHLKNKH